MKEKVIRKVKYLYHMLWCRLYSNLVIVDFIIHHYDEYENHRSNGLTVTKSINRILYKYYPKWAKHADETLKYK